MIVSLEPQINVFEKMKETQDDDYAECICFT